MWAFQYKHGDRPLEGFTIQRAAGRGGFGEVYYAISDSGREVALKVVQGYEQIELRGITQCMNLKSQHLVSIFDVKFNELGRPFVIMEYVSGANLRQLIDESPAGLGTQKAAFFLREIAKGLQYLHDCGIVHRDLKPGNIFYENGIVKIGDYGLSKSISTSQHSGQTVTVGTVHYMAPEIGAGKYDRSIDIYAMGAVLYEMLTGVVPFVGASPTEVLMKHLSAEPDCTNIPEPFCSTIRRAMAKDPVNRFQSIQEMVEAVFGAEHIQMSVSNFSTQDLSMVAGRVAAKVIAGGGAGGGGSGTFSPSSLPGQPAAPMAADRFHGPRGEVEPRGVHGGTAHNKADKKTDDDDDRRASERWAELGNDRLPISARLQMGATAVAIIAGCAGLFGNWKTGNAGSVDPVLVTIIVAVSASSATAVMLMACRKLAKLVKGESPAIQRLSIAAPAAVAANLFSLPLYFSEDGLQHRALWTVVAIAAPLLLVDIRSWLSPTRVNRVNPGHALAACGIGFVLCMIFGGSALIAVGVLAATALAVQIISPWDPDLQFAPQPPIEERYTHGGLGIMTDRPDAHRPDAHRTAHIPPIPVVKVPPPIPLAAAPSLTSASTPRKKMVYPPVRRAAPFIWLALFIALVAIGIPMIVASDSLPMRTWNESFTRGGKNYVFKNSEMTGEAIAFLCIGVSTLIVALFAMSRAITKTFKGWWPYLFRPVIRTACVVTIVTCGIILANATLGTTSTAALTSKIVLASLALIFFTVIPTAWFDPQAKKRRVANAAATEVATPVTTLDDSVTVSPRKRVWALLLAAIGFVGFGGLHRFYVGKVGTGILWMLTGGMFYFGTIIDMVMIASGEFTDCDKKKVLRWADEQLPGETSPPRAGSDLLGGFTRSISSALSNVGGAQAKAAAMARTAGGGIASALAALFIFAGTLVALALAIDVPAAIDAGRPDPRVKQQLLQAFTEINLVSISTDRAQSSSVAIDRKLARGLGVPSYRDGNATSLPPAGTHVRAEVHVSPASGKPVGGTARTMTAAIDDVAVEMQSQFRGFDRELARAIVQGTRDATRGGLPVRSAMEIKTAVAATIAMRDALKALEEARNSLAALEKSRTGAVEAASSAAVKGIIAVPNIAGSIPVPIAPAAWDSTDLESPVAKVGALDTADAASTNADEQSVAAPLRLIGVLASGTLYFLGVTMLVFARRSHGAPHLLRGIVAVGCVIGSMFILHTVVDDSQFWEGTAGASMQAMSQRAMQVLKDGPTVFAGATLLCAVVLMGWPPRRERARAAVVAETTLA